MAIDMCIVEDVIVALLGSHLPICHWTCPSVRSAIFDNSDSISRYQEPCNDFNNLS